MIINEINLKEMKEKLAVQKKLLAFETQILRKLEKELRPSFLQSRTGIVYLKTMQFCLSPFRTLTHKIDWALHEPETYELDQEVKKLKKILKRCLKIKDSTDKKASSTCETAVKTIIRFETKYEDSVMEYTIPLTALHAEIERLRPKIIKTAILEDNSETKKEETHVE